MRILIVSTSENNGGAAVAANRLMEALNNNGEKARMLVRDKQTDNISVEELPHRWWQKYHFLRERSTIFSQLGFQRKNLFSIDIANAGTDITRLKVFREADIVHLHWVNQGMLSLKDIRKIVDSGKPVVWTLHDAWPTTAICHVTLGCKNYQTHCHHCKYLPGGGSAHDLSYKIWDKKAALYRGSGIAFVACSRWLEGEAKRSALLRGQRILSIPNAIDTRIFCPSNQAEARQRLQLPQDKQLLLFVAQRTTNPLKGMDYLEAACRHIAEHYPDLGKRLALVVLGGESAESSAQTGGLEVFPIPYTSDPHRIADIYRAADVFCLPSLSENLPNTIMEAMACGVPCVAFKVGGIPEMIDHQRNGYLAAYKDADDLAEGLRWVLQNNCEGQLSREAVHKVVRNYSQQSVALNYIEVYNEVLASKKFNL